MSPEDLRDDDEAAGTIPPQATYNDFLRAYAEGTLNEAIYNLSNQDLNQDLLGHVEENAKACAGINGPHFPFELWTDNGKKVWPDVNGMVGDDFFELAVQDHPEELYQELKLRTLLALSL